MLEVATYRQALAGWLASRPPELADHRRNHVGTVEEAAAHGAGFLQVLYDQGWNRWGWPEEVGGFGGGVAHRATLYEELWAAGYKIPTRYFSLEILGPALARYAPHIAATHLPRFLSGQDMWCQGFSEPEAGSDLGALKLRAVDEGDRWRVNGQKLWTSFAHLSASCLLLARTGENPTGYRGLTMLWVDMSLPGITVRTVPTMSGENELAEVFFDDVLVPKDQVIGEVDSGWDLAMYLLQWERGMYAWIMQGWMHARLDDLLAQAPEAASAAADAVGRLYQMLFALRVKTADTIRELAADRSPGPQISADKVLLTRTEQALFDLARHLMPERFLFADDAEVQAWRGDWFYSRAASIYGGAIDVQRGIIAERLLGLPRGR